MSEQQLRPREWFQTLSGLDQMRRQIETKIEPSPMAKTLGFGLIEVDAGWAVVLGEPIDGYLNPGGVVHGGWALTLMDTCCGAAAHTLLPPATRMMTLETKCNFVRPILPKNGAVRAEGRALGQGRRIFTAEGKIFDSSGKLLAHGTSTLMVASR